jgi:hypothetical protein
MCVEVRFHPASSKNAWEENCVDWANMKLVTSRQGHLRFLRQSSGWAITRGYELTIDIKVYIVGGGVGFLNSHCHVMPTS